MEVGRSRIWEGQRGNEAGGKESGFGKGLKGAEVKRGNYKNNGKPDDGRFINRNTDNGEETDTRESVCIGTDTGKTSGPENGGKEADREGKEERSSGVGRRRKLWQQILPGFATLALAILFFFLLYSFDSLWGSLARMVKILIPFVYGGVMAYMLRMPCNFFEKYLNKWLPGKLRKQAEGIAVLLSLFSAFLILYLLFSMVVPQMASSVNAIVAELPAAGTRATKWVENQLADNPILENYLQTAIEAVNTKFQTWAQTDLLPMLTNMVDGFASTVSTVVTVIFNLFIGVIVCIYTLGSRKQFARQAKAVLYSVCKPKWADYIMEEVSYADKMFVGFFSGKILDSAIIGVICYICSLLLGFPNAMLISVIVGVTNIIPYFGPYIGAVPSALLILIVDPVKCLWFIVFIIILQQFDGNILGPRLLANSTGLSGFWVLFSVTVFSGLFGFAGILVGVPVFAVIYDLIRKLVVHGLKKNGKLQVLRGEEATEGEEEKTKKNNSFSTK